MPVFVEHLLRYVSSPEHRQYGVARQDTQDEEYEGEKDEEHGDRQQQPLHNVPPYTAHRFLPFGIEKRKSTTIPISGKYTMILLSRQAFLIDLGFDFVAGAS
jgi:hypothetical protein